MTLNPVLRREIKERMRSRRAAIILVLFVTLLALILYFVYRWGEFQMRQVGFGGDASSASLGRLMFEWLTLFLLLFVAFIAPGIAAGSIVGERERRTMHTLQVTLLSPREIVLGKLAASTAFVTLLVVASAPLFAVPLVLGGVTPWEVVRALIVVLATEIALAAFATYLSSRAKRVQFATVAAYAVALFLLFGTGILFAAEMVWRSYRGPSYTEDAVSIVLNPVVALGDASGQHLGSINMPLPLSGIASGVAELMYDDDFLVLRTGQTVDSAGPEAPARLAGEPLVQGPRDAPLLRLWIIHLALLALVTTAALVGAARRVRAPAARMPRVRERPT